ncbi:MAG: LysR family transcriptional regulator [Rhodoblastus sp.]
MSIVLLRSFVEVYRQGSVSRAARELGLTQPAVSGHIASLEALLERKLFTRQPYGMRPTTIADELAQRVSKALDTAEGALAEVRARSSVLSGTIHLCGPSEILSDFIVDGLRRLTAQDLAIKLIPSSDAASVELLIEGRVDFAFAIPAFDDPRIDHQVYSKEELVLVAAPPLADTIAQTGSLAAGLASTPYLIYDPQRTLIEIWLDYNGVKAVLGQELATAPDLRALRNFAASGLGWTVLPRYLAAPSLADAALREIAGPRGNPATTFHIHWLKSAMRNPRTAKARMLLVGD